MIYLFTLFLLLFFLIILSVFYVYNIFAVFKGSPFVPTSGSQLERILKKAGLKKGQKFVDLGCGDGRLVEYAVSHFGVAGVGVDVNAVLIIWARIRCILKKIPAVFFTQNIFETELGEFDVIFVFLMPKMLVKLAPRFKKLKKGTRIISHGFKLPTMENSQIAVLEEKPFSTYYYKI